MTAPRSRQAPPDRLDERFATLPKLKTAAFLAGCTEADFGAVASACELSAPTLSKAAAALETAGYVRVRKGYLGRRPRTWLALTPLGRAAFERHLGALAALGECAKDLDAAACPDRNACGSAER